MLTYSTPVELEIPCRVKAERVLTRKSEVQLTKTCERRSFFKFRAHSYALIILRLVAISSSAIQRRFLTLFSRFLSHFEQSSSNGLANSFETSLFSVERSSDRALLTRSPPKIVIYPSMISL